MKHIVSHKLFENERELPYELELIHQAMNIPQRTQWLTPTMLEKNLREIDEHLKDQFEDNSPISVVQSLHNAVNLAKQHIDSRYLVIMPEDYIKSSYVKHYIMKISQLKLLYDKTYDMGIRKYSITDWHTKGHPRVEKTEQLTAKESLVLYENKNDAMTFLKWDIDDLFDFEHDDYNAIDKYEESDLEPFDLSYYVIDYRLLNALNFAQNISNHSTRSREFLDTLKQHSREDMVKITMMLSNFGPDEHYLYRHNKIAAVYDFLKKSDFFKDITFDEFMQVKPFLTI